MLNVYTAGSAYDAAAKTGTVFTARSYIGPIVKTFITIGGSTRRDPLGHEPVVISVTAGYLITGGGSPGSD